MRFLAPIIFAFSLPLFGEAGSGKDLAPPNVPSIASSSKEESPPAVKVPESDLKLPEMPPYYPRLPKLEIAKDYTAEVVARLQRAANEVRLLEVWSLDPSVPAAAEMESKSRPYPFHDFHSIGREELKDKEAVQKLLYSVTIAIARGPYETNDCFNPRHGLRIYDKKGFIDVVLCYTCLEGVIYDGKNQIWFSTSRDAEADFDAAFAGVGLKKAP